MKRRKFLQTSAIASVPILLNGIPVSASPNTGSSFMDKLAESAVGCGNILVIIQLNGGNDALNTYFPVDKWSSLAAARSNILMQENQTLKLNDNDVTKLHPALAEVQQLYNEGKVMLVQGVSYPNPSFSHFRATDIWFSASGSNTTLSSGWMGRTLDNQYTNYPNGYPNADMPDPLAIQIGSSLPFSLQGPNINMGYNVSNPATLLNVINGVTDPAPNNDYGRELSFLRLMKDQSNAYKQRIQDAYNTAVNNPVTYPTPNSLADSLKIVARLINGGLKTPIYVVNHGNSFDTHENQVSLTDFTQGTHANMLGLLSKAIGAFQQELTNMGKAHKVTGMTHSEFGRRIKSNASYGTDHGSAAPVMFFGAALNTALSSVNNTNIFKRGMIGNSPNLPAAPTVNDQVPMQYDFRQLYASVMEQWFCMTSADSNAVLGTTFNTLPIFRSAVTTPGAAITLVGQYFGSEAKLTFQVTSNPSFVEYIIEYSTDNISFAPVQRVPNNSLNDAETYYATVNVNAPKMYFRIAGQKFDGSLKYSNVLFLKSDDKQLLSVFPNPISNFQINISFFVLPKSQVDINIFNAIGAKVYHNRFAQTTNNLGFKIQPVAINTHYYMEILFDGERVVEEIIFR